MGEEGSLYHINEFMINCYRKKEKSICNKGGAFRFSLTGSSAAAGLCWIFFNFDIMTVTVGDYHIFLVQHFNLQTKQMS